MTGGPLQRDDTDHGVDVEAPKTERPLDEHAEANAGANAEPNTHEGIDETTDEPGDEPGDEPISDPQDLTSPGRQIDPEATVNLTGDFDATVNLTGAELPGEERDDAAVTSAVTRGHLKGLLEALIFASDRPIKTNELAKASAAASKLVKELLEELKGDFTSRGVQLDEVAGGWIFRTNAAYAPFVRDLTKQKPARLSRAQIETLAILAYRQPITRPEIDDIRGVDCGPVLKLLLERDLVRMLGRKDEPGRPVIYGTTVQFLELFGLKSLKDLPTLREFTDLNEESRRTVERELGETLEETVAAMAADGPRIPPPSDTLPPNDEDDGPMNTEIPPPMPEMSTAEDHLPDAEHAADPAKKTEGEVDAEEEFPDDDDDDFDDDDEDDDDEDEEDEEAEKEDDA